MSDEKNDSVDQDKDKKDEPKKRPTKPPVGRTFSTRGQERQK